MASQLHIKVGIKSLLLLVTKISDTLKIRVESNSLMFVSFCYSSSSTVITSCTDLLAKPIRGTMWCHKFFCVLFYYKYKRHAKEVIDNNWVYSDCLCGLVVRVLGYRFRAPGSIPGTTRKKEVVGLERGPLSLSLQGLLRE
jgi:hypothetical protein